MGIMCVDLMDILGSTTTKEYNQMRNNGQALRESHFSMTGLMERISDFFERGTC